MKFEKQMKKHIDKVLDENVPNPYPAKKRSFPHWLKIAMPISTGVLAASVALAIVVPMAMLNRTNNQRLPSNSEAGNNSSISQQQPSYPTDLGSYSTFVTPKNRGVQNMDYRLVNRTALKAINNLDSYLKDQTNKNFVISPASFLLTVSGMAAVSENFNLDAYGLVDPIEDTKALLEYWNCYWDGQNHEGLQVGLDSGIFHQTVGPKYPFSDEKRKEVEDANIGTGVASFDNYLPQAQKYFEDSVGLTIPVPDAMVPGGGVISYGALKLVDLAAQTFTSGNNDFHVDGKTISVNTAIIGSQEKGVSVKYYENEQYQVFVQGIGATQLAIVLPREGIALESISISEAYSNIINSKTTQYIYGYLPYFHLQSSSVDITEAFTKNLSGQEKLYSKLLVKEDAMDMTKEELLFTAMQSSDFEFCEKGVFGQSVSAIGSGSGAIDKPKTPIEIKVDHPFYAISLKDNFPLFVNKVNDPSK